jgi:hypothetical protein
MRTATLNRLECSNEGTFGMMTLDDGTVFHSLELPWRDNQCGKSCIPHGTYTVNWRYSPKHGDCYHVDGVAGRSDVEIHAANWAGDVAMGYKCQLLGCIALGMSVGDLEGQKAVLTSRMAVLKFNAALGGDSFLLTITG